MFVWRLRGFGMDQLLASHHLVPGVGLMLSCFVQKVQCCGGQTNRQCLELIKIKPGGSLSQMFHMLCILQDVYRCYKRISCVPQEYFMGGQNNRSHSNVQEVTQDCWKLSV